MELQGVEVIRCHYCRKRKVLAAELHDNEKVEKSLPDLTAGEFNRR